MAFADEIVILIANEPLNHLVDAAVTISVPGEYIIPDYYKISTEGSGIDVTFTRTSSSGTTNLSPGIYYNFLVGDIITVLNQLTSSRIYDTREVLLVGPKVIRIIIRTLSNPVFDTVNFGNLIQPWARYENYVTSDNISGGVDVIEEPSAISSNVTLSASTLIIADIYTNVTGVNIKVNGILGNNLATNVRPGDIVVLEWDVQSYFEDSVTLYQIQVDSFDSSNVYIPIGTWGIENKTIEQPDISVSSSVLYSLSSSMNSSTNDEIKIQLQEQYFPNDIQLTNKTVDPLYDINSKSEIHLPLISYYEPNTESISTTFLNSEYIPNDSPYLKHDMDYEYIPNDSPYLKHSIDYEYMPNDSPYLKSIIDYEYAPNDSAYTTSIIDYESAPNDSSYLKSIIDYEYAPNDSSYVKSIIDYESAPGDYSYVKSIIDYEYAPGDYSYVKSIIDYEFAPGDYSYITDSFVSETPSDTSYITDSFVSEKPTDTTYVTDSFVSEKPTDTTYITDSFVSEKPTDTTYVTDTMSSQLDSNTTYVTDSMSSQLDSNTTLVTSSMSSQLDSNTTLVTSSMDSQLDSNTTLVEYQFTPDTDIEPLTLADLLPELDKEPLTLADLLPELDQEPLTLVDLLPELDIEPLTLVDLLPELDIEPLTLVDLLPIPDIEPMILVDLLPELDKEPMILVDLLYELDKEPIWRTDLLTERGTFNTYIKIYANNDPDGNTGLQPYVIYEKQYTYAPGSYKTSIEAEAMAVKYVSAAAAQIVGTDYWNYRIFFNTRIYAVPRKGRVFPVTWYIRGG